MAKRKLKTLSLVEKVDIIARCEASEGKRHSQLAKEFGIPESTLSRILAKKEELKDAPVVRGNLKRQKCCEYPDVEKSLLEWFKQVRDRNVPVHGPMLQEKAKEFAAKLKIQAFAASNGWLEGFKKRHQILFRQISGEGKAVDDDVCSDWMKQLPDLLQQYNEDDIYNADETALFFKCLPDKTMAFKGEKCSGGKHSKERVSLLLATNMSGTDKLQPLLIGKAAKPRAFKGVKSLPLSYKWNKKAWMTTKIFNEWLQTIDKQMGRKKRKILLFIDNCPAHNNVLPLKNVTVMFLPPNTTSALQPLDQGIIQNFKVYYRKCVVRHILDAIEKSSEMSVNLLQAMRMASKAWHTVSQTTISNCFRKCGFIVPTDDVAETCNVNDDDDDDFPEWNEVCNTLHIPTEISFGDFVAVDADVVVTEFLSDDDIVNNVLSQSEGYGENDDEDEEPQESTSTEPQITRKDAMNSLNALRIYFERSDDIQPDVFNSLHSLEQLLDRKRVMNQTKITDFVS